MWHKFVGLTCGHTFEGRAMELDYHVIGLHPGEIHQWEMRNLVTDELEEIFQWPLSV